MFILLICIITNQIMNTMLYMPVFKRRLSIIAQNIRINLYDIINPLDALNRENNSQEVNIFFKIYIISLTKKKR